MVETVNAGPVRVLPFVCRAEGSEALFVRTASLVAKVDAAARGEAGGARAESYA